MSDGTIDFAGFRADLKSIADNNYPRLALAKLPFNWFAPATAGIIQSTSWDGTALPHATLTGIKNGSAIVVFMNLDSQGTTPAPTVGCLDSVGSVYTQIVNGYLGITPRASGYAFITENVAGGTITANLDPASHGGNFWEGMIMLEVGGVAGVSATAFGSGTATATGNEGDLAISFGASDTGGIGTWTDASGWALVTDGLLQGNHCVQQKAGFGGVTTNTQTYSAGTPPCCTLIVMLTVTDGGSPPPPPITPIPLPGPCNFLSLVSEAIDESGNYFQSALIGEQAAAGFIRLNGQGNVWIPISFASPLMPGYVSTANNYGTNPIAGTGFNALEAPFGTLEWRPSQPVLYSTPQPPTAPAGYLLAFVGLNVGAGSGIGNGTSSTFAIPSAAGAVDRKKNRCLL